ncbi:sensor histidine kinase [Mycoplasma sp. P36-A1]|uniref:sensor histidine kinase n=1 Tax=Mycoplasma sp. P36-A1 TaxID=3252900 RepID=UPI003C2EDD52
MENNKLSFVYLTFLWIGNLGIFAIFKVFDDDFGMTRNSFINVVIFSTILYLILLTLNIINYKKQLNIKNKQLTVFEEHDYVIDEYKNNQLLQEMFKKNARLRSKMLSMNEEQNRWIHDVKIPLSTLKLFIANNKTKFESDDIRILSSIATKISDDVNKKIMFDKIELEIDDIKPDKFNVKDLIKTIIKVNKDQFFYKSMSINLDIPDFSILSDERTLRYSLEQIFANALKYADDKSELSIYLSDNTLWIKSIGSPLSIQDSKRIFEKGYTGSNSINKGMASTGIGIYMVKKSLKFLDLDIKVRVYDKTTEFGITFNKLYTD